MKRSLKKFGKGGPLPRKPIIVSDPNDKRLRAYNDSLVAYNFGEEKLKNPNLVMSHMTKS